jgi:hypothetical protein
VYVYAGAVLEHQIVVRGGHELAQAAREVGAPGEARQASAAERLNVLCPEIRPGNAGVTNVRRW